MAIKPYSEASTKHSLVSAGFATPEDILTPLHRGHSQLNYKLSIARSSTHNTTSCFFIKQFTDTASFQQTLTIYRSLHHTQLTLPIIKALSAQQVIIQPWIEATAVDQSILSVSDKVSVLVDALTRLHQHQAQLPTLKLPELLTSAFSHIQQSQLKKELYGFSKPTLNQFINTITPQQTSLCHLDLSFGNILLSPITTANNNNAPQIIDWEYAARSHPIIDISNAACINRLSSQEINHLLSSYQAYRCLDNSLLATAIDFSTLLATAWYIRKAEITNQEIWKTEAHQIFDWRNSVIPIRP